MRRVQAADPLALAHPPQIGGTAAPRGSLVRRAIAPASLVLLWAATTSLGWVHPSVLPSPGAVASGLASLWFDQNLLRHVATSLGRALLGASVGSCVGLGLGCVAGLSRLGEEAFDALFHMMRAVPFLALVPLFIVWFGIGETPKILLIALASSFPLYVNTYAGVRGVDAKLIEAMRCFELHGLALLRQVVLPLAMPSIMTGLRFSLTVSILVLIAAEQINTSVGLGYLLTSAQAYQQVDTILICIAIYALLGLTVDALVRKLECLVMPWRSQHVV